MRNILFSLLLLFPFFLAAQCPTGVNTYTVTSSAGNNAVGTFARACQCVNMAGSTIKTIQFNISGATVIQPTAVAPLTITADNVLVDGTSQSGIIVDGGSAAGPSSQGIIVTGTGTTIQGLTIRNFTASAGGNAIWLGPSADAVTIISNTLHNNRNGVFLTDGGLTNAFITANSMYCNAVKGINRGVDPSIPSITVSNTQRIKGTGASPNATIEVYRDDKTGCAAAPCQGKSFIGSTTATATGAWDLLLGGNALQASDEVVATSTINGNNTSEFTTCATVADCSSLGVTVVATDVTCSGLGNGMATATPISAASPTFSWSNGASTATISSLVPGTYTVTVTDAAGCTATETATIAQPALLTTTFNTMPVACFGGNNGTATAIPAGGTPNYTYLWNTGSAAATINSLMANIYTVTVTDAKGCTIVRNTQVTQPTQLTVNTNATNESAAGANDGAATATAGGGTPVHTFLWSNTATTATINNLSPGTYTVTVTDMNGCTQTATATINAGQSAGPCTALPVYAVLGPSEVCGNSTLSLEVDDLFPGPDIRYWWYFPNGDSAQTLVPMLDILATSSDFSGEYFVVRDSAGCRSIPVGGAPVSVLSLDPAQVFAGNDTLICAAGVVVLKAVQPPQGTGMWVSLGNATIDDPGDFLTAARNLQTGANTFVWQVSLGACTAAASDTVVYFLEKKAVLGDDRYVLQYAQDIAVMEVLLNDNLSGIPDTVITQLGAPASGTLEYLENGKRFRYMAEDGYRGTVQFQYVVCSPASACNLPCDTALVTIDIQNLPSVPEGIVVDDPGPNGRLTIKGISGFSRVEISIFDRWGDLVFQENNYRNDDPWLGYFSGKPLPQAAYYYYLKAWDGNAQIGSTQTGIVHLFIQE